MTELIGDGGGRSAGKTLHIASLHGNHQQHSLVTTFACHIGIASTLAIKFQSCEMIDMSVRIPCGWEF